MADVSKLSDEQVDQVFEDCLNLENAFYKKGWDEGFAKVNKEAVRDGENYGYFSLHGWLIRIESCTDSLLPASSITASRSWPRWSVTLCWMR